MTEKELRNWTSKYCLDLSKEDTFSNYQLRILKLIINIVSKTTDAEPTIRQVFLYMNNHSQDYIFEQIDSAMKEECSSEYLDPVFYNRTKDTLYQSLYIAVYLSPWFKTEKNPIPVTTYNKVETA